MCAEFTFYYHHGLIGKKAKQMLPCSGKHCFHWVHGCMKKVKYEISIWKMAYYDKIWNICVPQIHLTFIIFSTCVSIFFVCIYNTHVCVCVWACMPCTIFHFNLILSFVSLFIAFESSLNTHTQASTQTFWILPPEASLWFRFVSISLQMSDMFHWATVGWGGRISLLKV